MGSVSWICIEECRVTVLFLALGYLVCNQVDFVCCHTGPRHGGVDLGAVHRDPAEGEFCTFRSVRPPLGLLFLSSWLLLLLAVWLLILLRWAMHHWNSLAIMNLLAEVICFCVFD